MRRSDTTLDDPSTPASPKRTVATLRILFSAGAIHEAPAIELDGAIEIGRAVAPPGVLLDDAHASRSHARLEIDARAQRAVAVNASRRGTDLDGVPIERAALADGQILTLGHTLALFRWEERPLDPDAPLPGVLGSAPSMRRIRALIATLAPSDAVVSLQGETGTGKEVIARAIHEASRRKGDFVAVNCAAIPESLAEAQLFGHVAGAFTGARGASEGFFRAAAGGTLFLDEVGELPAALQAKLLRALETGAVAPLGSFKETPHDARVLTATHRDLVEDVESGRFRRDLYARISDFVVTLPPLRERREDVLPLLRMSYGAGMPPLDFALARALLLHPWPFNVREIVRLASQLRIRAAGQTKLDLELVREGLERSRRLATPSGGPPPELPDSSRAKPPDRAELEELLARHHGVVADVARAVGRSRKQVYRWIQQCDLDPEAFRGPE